MSNSIFDVPFSSMPGGVMYQGWVMPDVVPDQPQPVLKNWHPEDLAAYVGGQYTNTQKDGNA